MKGKRLWLQMIGLTLTMLLLVTCGATQHTAVQRVEAFHKAINDIKPGKETGEGQTDVSKGMATLEEIFKKHMTTPGLPMSFLTIAMASGTVRFSNVEYELVSESAECAVVKAMGEVTIGGGSRKLDEEYVVVKQGDKWLIDLGARSCD